MDHHHHQEQNANGNCRKVDEAEGRKRMAIFRVRELVVEDVDKQADDFIKNFRKQLKLEREESFKRHGEAIARRRI